MTGRWKTEPALARTTFGLVTSAVPATVSTARAPMASAVRMMVPTFPGSRPWAMMT